MLTRFMKLSVLITESCREKAETIRDIRTTRTATTTMAVRPTERARFLRADFRKMWSRSSSFSKRVLTGKSR